MCSIIPYGRISIKPSAYSSLQWNTRSDPLKRIYTLASLTEFAELLKDNLIFVSKHALLITGVFDRPDWIRDEWNAAADEESYRYVTEKVTDL